MEFHARVTQPDRQRTACAVVGVFENRHLSSAARALDKASSGAISKALRRGDASGKLGRCLVLHDLSGILASRVLLVGCGPQQDIDDIRYRKILDHAVDALSSTGARDAVSYLPDIEIESRGTDWKCRQFLEACRDRLYRFDQLKSQPPKTPRNIRRITLNVPERDQLEAARQSLADGAAIADGTALARDLGNLPGNVCTPAYLAEQARELAKKHSSLKVRVLGESEMKRLSMGSLLSVARGSREPAKLIVLQYTGAEKRDAPIVLIGKGVTFDSGGISIKPSAAMDEMKFDMCGAASVLGTLRATATLGLALNVVGLIPATENLPGGNASKPGDIVTSMSGHTIEVLNTDAEGRLILIDALTYAGRFNPDVVIDIATLTGACVVALGSHASGLFSNHASLAKALLDAGNYTGDRAWEMPLWEAYQDQLKSNFADMANIGGREAGAITAACFLARFAREYDWAHLDIAGAAWFSGAKKGATGRPVKLLTQYLLDRAKPA